MHWAWYVVGAIAILVTGYLALSTPPEIGYAWYMGPAIVALILLVMWYTESRKKAKKSPKK